MDDQVSDPQGTVYRLGDELGDGGQGKVFAVAGHGQLVIKRFHDALLKSDDCDSLRQKVTALQSKRLGHRFPQVAWPQFDIFDGGGQWCGYAMRKVKGLPLLAQRFLNPGLLEREYPHIRRLELAALALAFLETVLRLQAENVEIGDYNQSNFRFDPLRKQLGFIDTDAYQVRHQGGAFICPVTSPELTPPELLNTPVRYRWRNPHNEVFSAAIIAFLILMPGKHPFDALGSDDAGLNLRQGGFPYRPADNSAGPPTGRVPNGIWGQVWEDFPLHLQQRFTAIFLTGHADPEKRGSLTALRQAVAEYHAGLTQGRHFLMPKLGSPPPAGPALTPAVIPAKAAAAVPVFHSPAAVPGAASAPPGTAIAGSRSRLQRQLSLRAFFPTAVRRLRPPSAAQLKDYWWRFLELVSW